MKKLIMVIGILLLGTSIAPAQYNPQGSFGVSFDAFYSSLSPYGEWIPVDGGMYGWRPVGVEVGWRPYVYGHWVWTEYGWYWTTDEPWGWAVFHYGRWYYDDYYGWVWIPGYDWAPAWVEWRYGGPFLGWAPLGPYAVFRVGVGIHYSVRWRTPAFYWNFVDCRYMTSGSLHRYVYRSEGNTRYIGRTRFAGSVEYSGGKVVTRGPDRQTVEQRANIRIDQADIVDVRDRQPERIIREGSRDRIEVYRPRIEAPSREGALDRPERVRQSDRRISLDAQATDIGAREAARGTVDRERPSGGVRGQPDASVGRDERAIERQTSPQVAPPATRGTDKTVKRQQPAQGQQNEGTRRIERKAQPPKETVERQRVQREEQSKQNPERSVRRSESPRQGGERARPSQPAPRGERKGRDR